MSEEHKSADSNPPTNEPTSSDSNASSSVSASSVSSGKPRRNFLASILATVISAVLMLVPLVSGLLFFLDPILRKKGGDDGGSQNGGARKDDQGFIRLDVTIDALPADGAPQLVTVYDDIVDAWNKFIDQPIGTVWLRRMPNSQVIAFSTICPHLGCSVEHRQAEKDFFCPCHTSAFNLDGDRINMIPPRNMDTLEVKLKEETGQTIWLKYQEFRGAEEEKTPV